MMVIHTSPIPIKQNRNLLLNTADPSRISGWISPSTARILLLSVFLMLTSNGMLFSSIVQAYPLQTGNFGFISSLAVFFLAATALLLLVILQGRRLTTWLSGWFLVTSAICAHFMDRYGSVIDIGMLENALQTDAAETMDLLDWRFAARVLLFGILPTVLLWRRPLPAIRPLAELKSRLLVATLLVATMAGCIALQPARYASFIREHKQVRYYANPLYPSWSAISLVGRQFRNLHAEVHELVAGDAKLDDVRHTIDRKELIILVVGETARADRFSLNGYSRDTNPVLAGEDVVSFRNVSSCGTSTAISVPCMFSGMGADEFSLQRAAARDNVLDVLKRNDIEILWRDNNSDSKGVALRVPFEDFKSPELNPLCDVECRDEGMLSGLDTWIKAHPDKDLLVVLHQMGNHGPAYYKRYPEAFAHFQPVCKTSELSACSQQELDNAYDNAIRYTDHFLGRVIAKLKQHDQTHATAMLYVSDHGESLGENGLYLHGAPKLIAPKEQTHVAAIAWVGQHFDIPLSTLRTFIDKPLSHSDLFCTLLTAFEVGAEMCKYPRPPA